MVVRTLTVNPSRKLPRFESLTRHTGSERPLTCDDAVEGRSRPVRLCPGLNGQIWRSVGISWAERSWCGRLGRTGGGDTLTRFRGLIPAVRPPPSLAVTCAN